MQFLNTALSVTVISFFLQGCATGIRVNLSSRDIDTTPLPTISAPISLSPAVYVKINTVDKKPIDAIYVNVDEGSHTVEYSCRANGIDGSGHLTIPVQPGMSYLLQGRLLTKTNTTNSIERVGTQTYVERDASGRLIQSHEPVYSNFERSSTNTVGCTAKVLECDGYPYLDGNRVVCKKEPIGTLKTIIFKGGENDYKKLF